MQVNERTAEKLTAAMLRLRKHADYQRAYTAAARKQHSREMSFFVARRDSIPAQRLHPAEALLPTLSGPRIGLTVPKVLGKAHDRNRIKRRMRAAVALHAGELGGLPMDVILHPRRSVLLLDWDRLQEEVRQAFRTARRGYDSPPGTLPKPGSSAGNRRNKRTKKTSTAGTGQPA